jgi:hypothetical protein
VLNNIHFPEIDGAISYVLTKGLKETKFGDENIMLIFHPRIAWTRQCVQGISLEDVYFTSNLAEQISLYFPKIKEIYLDNCRNSENQFLYLKNFEKLKILRFCQINSTFKTLPSSLEKLSCRNCYNLDDESLFSLSNTSIRHLELLGINKINGSGFKYLPKTLETLTCAGHDLTAGLYNLSHTHLKTLKLIACPESIDVDSLKYLPKTLESFHYFQFTDFFDEGFHNLSHTSLKDLILIAYEQDLNIKGSGFAALPQTLTSLVCHGFKQLEGEKSDLSRLTNLKTLRLSSSQINGPCSKLFPSSLLQLYCVHSKFTKGVIDLQNLNQLKILDLSFTNIHESCLKKLPQSLEKLIVEGLTLTNETRQALLGRGIEISYKSTPSVYLYRELGE